MWQLPGFLSSPLLGQQLARQVGAKQRWIVQMTFCTGTFQNVLRGHLACQCMHTHGHSIAELEPT